MSQIIENPLYDFSVMANNSIITSSTYFGSSVNAPDVQFVCRFCIC